MCGGLYGGGGSGFFRMLFTCNCNIIHMYTCISLSDTCTCNSMVTTPIGLFV